MTKILVTGSSGFMGRNLVQVLRRTPDVEVLEFDSDNDDGVLRSALSVADVVFHLAGVNRPENEAEFYRGNAELTSYICSLLNRRDVKPLLVMSSSTQAALQNPYGLSKKQAEEAVQAYGADGGRAVIFRLPNVFGKWSRPNYNSVVATFCHNIAHGLPISISDPNRVIELAYIDDVVDAFVGLLQGTAKPGSQYCNIAPTKAIALGELAKELYSMRAFRETLLIPDLSDRFSRALYATYVSFLPSNALQYHLTKREDHRGVLAELLKSPSAGQMFISRTRPGITRGNHFHHTKVEKFCVIEGDALIRFRSLLDDRTFEYRVHGKDFIVVDIPPGLAHSIENIGVCELIVLFWASEMFDPNRTDTYASEVLNAKT